MELSRPALEMLLQLFGDKSNLQLPVAVASLVLEIRGYAEHQLAAKGPEVE